MTQSIKLGQDANEFLREYIERGASEEDAQQVLNSLLELAVTMFRKGDIRTVIQGEKMELVCQLKKGSRRIKLK